MSLTALLGCMALVVLADGSRLPRSDGRAARSNPAGGTGGPQGPVPPEFVVTNASTPRLLDMLATPQNEVLFTTVRLPDKKYEDALDMMANFCYYVWKTGALDHLLILTTDNG